MVQQWPQSTAPKKRVFILTDGCVPNPAEVYRVAGEMSELNRIFTFGLSNECDRELV